MNTAEGDTTRMLMYYSMIAKTVPGVAQNVDRMVSSKSQLPELGKEPSSSDFGHVGAIGTGFEGGISVMSHTLSTTNPPVPWMVRQSWAADILSGSARKPLR
jgi:hypothetical protein